MIHGASVHGVNVRANTGCAHHHSPLDIVAIRFKCCNEYYSCFACHEALADHPRTLWLPSEYHEEAVLCGDCGHRLTISEYIGCESRCPRCLALFNPGCVDHRHLYFSD